MLCAATLALLVGQPQRAQAWVFGNNDSNTSRRAISDTARYVVFQSTATNFVPGDTNGQQDIFRLDNDTGAVERVNVSSAGAQAIGGISQQPTISGDGNLIVFSSAASNLVTSDTNSAFDVFVRDMSAGTTRRLSVNTAGTQGNGNSSAGFISNDGNTVAFESGATNLVAADTNARTDVFVRPMAAGSACVLASVTSAGAQGNDNSTLPSLSNNGSKVGFISAATNLVAGDANGDVDVFVRDTGAGTTIRASVSTAGTEATGGSFSTQAFIGGLGVKIVFTSDQTNLVSGDTNGVADIFMRDTFTNQTTRISVDSVGTQANGASSDPSLDGDELTILYGSSATNLVSGDTNGVADLFRRTLTFISTTRMSTDSSGGQANGLSQTASITADGTRACFASQATNLVAGDTNGFKDVFTKHIALNTVTIPVTLSTFQAE